tara:strand:- start:70183 stop:72198 length:2016 start_codon:yes stop_codon:yes gene_type:complete
MIRLVVTLNFILWCNFLYGGFIESSNDSIKIKKSLNEVVVTAQFEKKNKQDAIHDVIIISANTINSGAFSNLSEILKFQSNIKLSNDNILGSQINIQGISGENIKILIDGVPVVGRLNGNIDISQISLKNVERIEIVEGPLSVEYGSDALGGTVNIITKKSENIVPVFESYYESIGKYSSSLSLKHKYKHQQLTNFFTREYFNGWSENDDFIFLPKKTLADTNRFKKWKPKEKISNKITHYYLLNNNINLRSYYDYFYEKITNRGMPLESTNLATAFDDYYYTYRKNIGTELNIKQFYYSVQIIAGLNNYERIKNTYLTNLTSLSQSLLDDASLQDTSTYKLIFAKATLFNNKYEKINYQLGFDYNKQNANGVRIINNKQEQTDYALFSNFEYQINKNLILRPGIRVIYNDKYTAPIIPSTNLLYKFKSSRVRLSYAKGFRSPSLKELFFEFVDINHYIVGNPNLNAETSDNYRLSLSLNNKVNAFQYEINLSSFFNDINNKISLSNVEDQYSYFNIEKYKTKGLNLKFNLSKNYFSLTNSVSYIGRYNKLSKTQNKIPEFNYSLEFNSNIKSKIYTNTYLNIFYKFNGAAPVYTETIEGIKEMFSDKYQFLDIAINKKILKKIFFTIGCKNILDVIDINTAAQNTAHSTNNGVISIDYGRTFFANLKIEL